MSQLKEGMFSSNSSNQTNVFSTSLTFAGNLGHLTWVRHSSRKSSAARSYQRVWYFHVSKQWYGCQCLGFLTRTQMLLHAIAHGGCIVWSGDSLFSKASDWKARRNTDAGSSPRCGKRFFSQSQLSVQTLWQCPYSPVCNRMHQHLGTR